MPSDELRSENSRLKRELEESREEIRQLRNQVAHNRAVPAVPVIQPNLATPKPQASEELLDDASARFRLLEFK
jgi:hypothetical protein